MQAVKSSGEAEQILEQLVLHAAGARLNAEHLDLPSDFTIDKGLLQQVAQFSKLENNPWDM